MRNLFEADSALRSFTEEEIEAIYAAGELLTYAAGQTILTEGEAGDGMFVIHRGEVEIRLPFGSDLVLGRGEYFGELAFINPDHKRSASVFSKGETQLLMLDQDSITRLYGVHPMILMKLLRRTCAFLVDKESSLVSAVRAKNAELERTLDFLRRTREELSYQELLAHTDGLTGLYNRRCFDEQLPRFVERGEGVGLVMVDLDHFKPVNDTLGHEAGDVVLRNVARVLRDHVRKTDLPVRLGGDEFCVVLADVDHAAAQRRAEELRTSIADMPHPGRAHGLSITGSLGGTLYAPGEGIESFIRRADEVLYEAKRAGRNCLRWAV